MGFSQRIIMAVIDVTTDNFNATVENSEIVLLDFWAEWCGPCKAFGPVFEKTAEEFPHITFGKVNTEVEQGLAGHFQIRSIPTLMILKDQIIIFSQAGALPEQALKDIIKQVEELDMDEVRAEIAKQEGEESK
jgi:thioredoxin 1